MRSHGGDNGDAKFKHSTICAMLHIIKPLEHFGSNLMRVGFANHSGKKGMIDKVLRHFLQHKMPAAVSQHCFQHTIAPDVTGVICAEPNLCIECTGSILPSEVKRHMAQLVLVWGTTWEDLRGL
jgi:hypothetical protein